MLELEQGVIKEMPSKELLEDFLQHGAVGVVFNNEQGIFERTMERNMWLQRLDRSRYPLTEMPDRPLLEGFLQGFSGEVSVMFNLQEGKLERVK